MFIHRWTAKEDVVYIQNGILLSHKKNKIMPFAETRMDMEIIILSEDKPDVVVQSFSHVRLFVTPWTEAHQASLSFIISRSLFKLMSTESVMLFNHFILSHPLLLLPLIFPSIWVFSNEQALRIRWPKYWSFSFIICPSNEYSRLISFRIDWFDLLAVQGTLKSLLQHHSL